MKLIELFAGIGTQRKAFEEVFEQCETIAISEIDSRPLKIYQHLFNTCPNLGDITKIQSLPKADVWTYSFPCTDLSIAGNKQGFMGKNSSLIYEVLRLLKNSPKPQILIMENVSNLVSSKFITGFNQWISLLEEEGYNTFWLKMKASDYGGISIRNRVFAISILNNKSYVFPKKEMSQTVVKDILLPPTAECFVDNYEYIEYPYNYKNSIKICDYNNGGQGNRIYSINGKAITLTATGGGKGGSSGLYLRKEGLYKLSGIEMARVMGWNLDDAIKMSQVATNRELGFCLGNGIDLTVFTKIIQELKNQSLI